MDDPNIAPTTAPRFLNNKNQDQNELLNVLPVKAVDVCWHSSFMLKPRYHSALIEDVFDCIWSAICRHVR